MEPVGDCFLNQPARKPALSTVSHAARWRLEAANAIQGRMKAISSAEDETKRPAEERRILVP